jgi:hypothetical protein
MEETWGGLGYGRGLGTFKIPNVMLGPKRGEPQKLWCGWGGLIADLQSNLAGAEANQWRNNGYQRHKHFGRSNEAFERKTRLETMNGRSGRATEKASLCPLINESQSKGPERYWFLRWITRVESVKCREFSIQTIGPAL